MPILIMLQNFHSAFPFSSFQLTLVPLKPISNFLMKTEIDCPNIKRETRDNILLAFIAARLWKNSPKRTKRLSSLKLKTYLVFFENLQNYRKNVMPLYTNPKQTFWDY